MTKTTALKTFSDIDAFGTAEQRESWDANQYAVNIKNTIRMGVYQVAVMLKEVKDKHFSEPRSGWKKYVDEHIGVSYSTVVDLLRIVDNVFPHIDAETAEALGRNKLTILAKVADEQERLDLIKKVDPDMTANDLKKKVKNESTSKKTPGKLLKSPRTIANNLMKAYDGILDMLPYKDDPIEEQERKKRNLEEFAAQIEQPYKTLKALIEELLGKDLKDTFVFMEDLD
jgi:hypothetical protein